MYRLIIESLLGLRLTAEPQQARLHFAPCLPAGWQEFKLNYRYRETMYHITVRQSSGAQSGIAVNVDGVPQSEPTIALLDDRVDHLVEVNFVQGTGRAAAPAAALQPTTLG
jgi:cyclic beta-1,2-glucan synthetase